ncbi:MAG: helix-turn-helix domain-containing protein [Saprospiraceae bacterium]|nr:helix-turn-helix domain-containing protein [Saprospiraceae bacterium]
MEEEIPRVYFSEDTSLRIEVINFAQLLNKLDQSKNHDPFAVHKIEFYLILIITKNSYTHFVDFRSYELTPGSALFIAKNQVHHFTKGLVKADGFCILFSSLFVDNYHFLSDNLKLNRLFNYHIETPIIDQKQMEPDSFIEIANQLYDEYTFRNNFAKAEMLSILLQVLLLKAERAKEFQSISGVKTHWLVTFGTFKNMLEKEYANTRNSRDYASRLFISYKFLNDIVKDLTGKTVKAFIDEFVTIEIKRYLVSTSLSVKEISYKTGFEEPANMVKFFKKNTRTTPLKFRQQQ